MKKVIIIIALSFLLLAFNAYAIGLSVTPLSIKVNSIPRDVQFNTTITVYNSDIEEDTFILNSTGDIADWITFYSFENNSVQTNYLVVPGNGYNKFIANIKIPKDVPNGNYISKIYVGTSTYNVSVANISGLSMRIPIDVSLNVVGEQTVAGKVFDIIIPDVELYKLLNIIVDFQNTGNLVVNPDIRVSIKKGDDIVANFSHNQTSVSSGERKNIKVDWDTTFQDVGDFTANVKVYLDNILLDEKNLNFKILESPLTDEGEIEATESTGEALIDEVDGTSDRSSTDIPITGFFTLNALNLSVIAFVVFAFSLIIIGIKRSKSSKRNDDSALLKYQNSVSQDLKEETKEE